MFSGDSSVVDSLTGAPQQKSLQEPMLYPLAPFRGTRSGVVFLADGAALDLAGD